MSNKGFAVKADGWLQERGAGVLLHVTSLPGDTGIGTLGAHARGFVDLLTEMGMQYWQICPLGPTGFGDSPYQTFSAFAGNPYLVDLQMLVEAGLLGYDDLNALRDFDPRRIDYGAQYFRRWPVLRLAYRNFVERKLAYVPNYGSLRDFRKEHEAWLEPFAAFMALKEHYHGAPWTEWPTKHRTWQKAQKAMSPALEAEAAAHVFFQYLFFGQYRLLKDHAARNGVKIIGDIPIYVSLDSADAWANTSIFQMTARGEVTAVAGVPPDYFAPEGQLWGNPLFDWKYLKGRGYDWWLERLRMNFSMYDVVRIDHFRGFESYWAVPAAEADARKGSWQSGPGVDFFEAVESEFPNAPIIAEDLGEITPEVHALRDTVGLPGMIVLQFAWEDKPGNPYLPHMVSPNSVMYSGTHDNDTTVGWYPTLAPEFQDQLRRYLRVSGDEIAWDFVRVAYHAVSRIAMVPLQDLLNLGSEARLNTPGEAVGNWQWRTTWAEMDGLRGGTANYLRELAWLTGRATPPSQS